jgi:hypothetical protein
VPIAFFFNRCEKRGRAGSGAIAFGCLRRAATVRERLLGDGKTHPDGRGT